MNMELLINLAKNMAKDCEIISFDLFDTLVKRDVAKEEDIFAIIEKILKSRDKAEAYGYAQKRKRGMELVYRKRNGKEVTLQDIYAEMYEPEETAIDEILAIEEMVEVEVCTRNLIMGDFVSWCSAQGNKILMVITDTYLPYSVIVRILEKCRLKEFFDDAKIYVSSEVGMTKKSGALFRHIYGKENIPLGKWMHIGDAIRSDYLIPRSFGIKSIHVQRKINHCQFLMSRKARNKAQTVLECFQNNRIFKVEGYYQKFGYECLGPLVWGFSHWLREELSKKTSCKILFLSREGQFLKEAYSKIYGSADEEYFYVSRQALVAATYWMNDSIEDILQVIRFPHRFGRDVLYELLGLAHTGVAERQEIRWYTSVKDVLRDARLIEILNSKLTDIKRYSREQYEYLKQYMNFVGSCEEIVFVDIGWRSSMQAVFEKIIHSINPCIKVNGFYVGYCKSGVKTFGSEGRKGYLFGGDNGLGKVDEDKVFGFGGLFETLFMADHGSVRKYEGIGGEVYPVFHPCEYSMDYPQIREIQEGALKFVSDAKGNVAISSFIENKPDMMFEKLGEVGCHPTKQDIRNLGEIRILDGSERCLVEKIRYWPVSCLVNNLMNSGWKVAYIKRAFPFIPALCLYKAMKK